MRNIEVFTSEEQKQKNVTSNQEKSEVKNNGLENNPITEVDLSSMNINHAEVASHSGENLSGVIYSNTTGLIDPAPSESNDVLASTNFTGLLSSTSEYFGTLEIVDILREKPKYILQDDKGFFFVYYGGEGLNFVRTIQQLGGNVYVMTTETEILENQLFGDKVSFINFQAFKDKLVLMVIEIDGESWLLQIPADKYHTSKSYLKSLFIY